MNPRPSDPRGVIVWLFIAMLIVIVVGCLAAPRSGSAFSPTPALTGVSLPPFGGTPPTPAPANVAGSEGPSGLTTPMWGTTSRLGIISHMGDTPVPRSYLALPCKRGNVRCDLFVNLCGPADCVRMRQTDYGPSQRVHPNRIADVHPAVFERICGVPASFGLCQGSWTAIAVPDLPATDTDQ